MTWHRLRSIAPALLALHAVLATGLVPRASLVSSVPRSLFAVPTLDPATRVALPPGFSAAVDVATRLRFVHVVADDIDRDGDIDVVASVGTLELLVWQNDGAGHFYRMPPGHRPGLEAQPAVPSFDGDGFDSSQWIQNDHQRGARLEPSTAHADEGPERRLATCLRPAPDRYGPRVRSSRAPPIARSL